jgi:hypothetical protein
VKLNPGGQLAPENIRGRDALIDGFWQTLEQVSLYLNDLRRIGKTQIMVKMHAKPRPGWVAIKRDLGGCHTSEEFAELVYADSLIALPALKKTSRHLMTLLHKVSGTELSGVLKLGTSEAPSWKELLRHVFADLDQAMRDANQRIVMFWDEVPFLIDNIVRREGKDRGMEVLDLLRSLGQDHDRVRVFLTGSIGLHHVLKDLREDGYIGSPLNRMKAVEAGPLSVADGLELTRQLLTGTGIPCSDPDACAEAISTAVGQVPFYIHKLVAALSLAGPVTLERIQTTLDAEIRNPNGDWDLEHYRHRIGKYYGGAEPQVLAILDAVAMEQPLEFSALRRRVAATVNLASDEVLRGTLKLLMKDHYLVRDGEGRYQFYLELIRRWWCLDRDLSPTANREDASVRP